jgi:hypothetical protein
VRVRVSPKATVDADDIVSAVCEVRFTVTDALVPEMSGEPA